MAVAAIADIDTTAGLARVLRACPAQAWVIRPDGHLAAVVDAGDAVAVDTAIRRALGSAGARLPV